MSEQRASERITQEVTSWSGVEAGPGGRGEFAFKVGSREAPCDPIALTCPVPENRYPSWQPAMSSPRQALAPTVDAGGPYVGEEGTIDLAATAAAADGGAVAVSWDTDGDGEFEDGEGAEILASFADEGTFTVAARAVDEEGRASVDLATVEVSNRAPFILELRAEREGSQVDVSARVFDFGETDWLEATVDWGDAVESATIARKESGDGATVFAAHTYAGGAGARITLRVRDEDGAEAMAHVEVSERSTGAPPTLQDATATTARNVPVIVSMPLSDADDDDLRVELAQPPAHGSAHVIRIARGDRAEPLPVLYTPAADFVGTDSLIVRVSDGRP